MIIFRCFHVVSIANLFTLMNCISSNEYTLIHLSILLMNIRDVSSFRFLQIKLLWKDNFHGLLLSYLLGKYLRLNRWRICLFYIVRNSQAVFQNHDTTLHSHQQWMRAPESLHPCQRPWSTSKSALRVVRLLNFIHINKSSRLMITHGGFSTRKLYNGVLFTSMTHYFFERCTMCWFNICTHREMIITIKLMNTSPHVITIF